MVKVLFSAKLQHDVIKTVIPKLKYKLKDIDLILHDPTKDFLDLENLHKTLSDVDLFIVKIGSECSLDLLHFAKLYNIPTLHEIDTILMCKNKVSLDHALRKVFGKYSIELDKFYLPKSWTQSLQDIKKFKEWALPHIPFVIKSHYQHDKYMRFTFLVKKIEDIDKFCKMYSHFLYYDVYIQNFIESDGIDRKIYVIGDKIFGIKRENPIYMYLRDQNIESIDVDTIKRENFEAPEDMKNLAKILSRELKLKIFGFDLVKSIHKKFFLIDLNDFPGFRGIKNIDNILSDYIANLICDSC